MENTEAENTSKTVRNRYRLIIINDDTFEEVAVFKLTRLSVYMAMSTIFVVLVGITIALFSFTNLKFMIPGYGKQGSVRELRMLKIRADSMEMVVAQKQQYLDGVVRVLRGDTSAIRIDTAAILLPSLDSANPD